MSERGAAFLREIYRVSPTKIDLIPHGIPDLPFVDPSFHKDLFGVEGKIVLLSFGLLSANKGIETVIAALPAILAEHPERRLHHCRRDTSHVKETDGETYRFSLQWMAHEKGVEGNVIFYNRFVSLEELSSSSALRTYTSRLISTRRRSCPAPWPIRWGRARP